MKTIIPTVGVLIFNQNKVLLVKHTEKAGHITGTYGIPAGRLKKGETYIEGAIRELKEETGLSADKDSLSALPKLYGATIKRKGGTKNFSLKVYVCNKYYETLKETDETIPEWVPLSKVDKLNILPNLQNIISDGIRAGVWKE